MARTPCLLLVALGLATVLAFVPSAPVAQATHAGCFSASDLVLDLVGVGVHPHIVPATHRWEAGGPNPFVTVTVTSGFVGVRVEVTNERGECEQWCPDPASGLGEAFVGVAASYSCDVRGFSPAIVSVTAYDAGTTYVITNQ